MMEQIKILQELEMLLRHFPLVMPDIIYDSKHRLSQTLSIHRIQIHISNARTHT